MLLTAHCALLVQVSYSDVGGLGDQIRMIREVRLGNSHSSNSKMIAGRAAVRGSPWRRGARAAVCPPKEEQGARWRKGFT